METQSLNHELYTLLWQNQGSISEFIVAQVREFITCNISRDPEDRFESRIDGRTVVFWARMMKDGTIIAVADARQPNPICNFKAISFGGHLRHALSGLNQKPIEGNRWILIPSYDDHAMISYWDPAVDFTTSDTPSLGEEDLAAMLDEIPSHILIDLDETVMLRPNTVPPKDITFFPRDFPQGMPLVLPKEFIQKYCDVKFHHKVKPSIASDWRRGYEIDVSGITPAVIKMMDYIARSHLVRDSSDRWAQWHGEKYTRRAAKMTPQEYVTFRKVLLELGAKE